MNDNIMSSTATYQGHVIHPSSVVILKVVHLGNVIKNSDHISHRKALHFMISDLQGIIQGESMYCQGTSYLHYSVRVHGPH